MIGAAGVFGGLFRRLADRIIARSERRPPNLVIGAESPGGAYLRRWWLIPRNRFVNAYLHQILRDDDDRALHDHPWANLSILLHGGYVEHTIAPGGIHRRVARGPGSIKLRGPRSAHRLELPRVTNGLQRRTGCWSLFLTGPKVRRWGFHCPDRGWVDFETFTASKSGKPGEIGRGCE